MVPQNAPHEVGVVLDQGIALFKAAFGSVVALSFASALVRSLPYFYPSLTEVLLSSGVLTNTVAARGRTLGALGDLAVGFAVTWPVAMFLCLGVMVQMNAVANGGTLRWQTALARAWRRLLPLAGCLLAYAAIFALIVGTALLLAAAAVFPFLLAVQPALVSLVAGLVGMAFMLVAAIPLVVLFVYWCLALPLVAIEDLDAVAALTRSWRLVRGNWWRALVVLSVAGFIVFAVASLAGAAGMMLIAATDGGFGVRLTVVLVNAAGATLTTPLFVAVLLAMLEDLRPDPS
ncbi:MAG: glycerophosphoryl diester phosphodiesterase membrane domain-containing protein [Gammaproteobacteria bacterium]|nr:glycerophosphoryl diester phosphodiesterase membrane domain-containing protein [Gammaproteobacteria bacterium]